MRILLVGVMTALLSLAATSASALYATYDGDSLHGATGSLTITGDTPDATSGTFEVVWTIDFTDFDDAYAIETGHTVLTDIGFKAFSDVSFVSLDEILWSPATTGDLIGDGNVSNAGCQDDPDAGVICVADLDPSVNALDGGIFQATFTVTGDLMTDTWSFRGAFGPENGWVISEEAPPIPEPTAALVFACGLATASAWSRRRQNR